MMNKIRKRRYNHELRGLHFALSVIMYYISAHIRGICTFGGFGLLAVGLTMLYVNFYAAVYMITLGVCLIVVRFLLGDDR